MTRKTNHISILQFDERLISRLRVTPSSKGVDVIALDQERGEWSARDGSLEAALKAFVTAHKLAEDHVYTVLPRYDMTARILELPSESLAEIDGMIRLSAEEYVPFAADELVTDQCILESVADGGSRVLAVFAHRDVVETHVRLLAAAGIEPEQIYLSTACLASAVAATASTEHRMALVNLASGGLEVLVLRGKCLEYGRAVASQQDWALRGGLDDPAAQDVLEELSVEVRASLSAYRRESEDAEEVQTVFLCSEHVDVAPHCEALFQETGQECAPAEFARNLIPSGGETGAALPLVSLGAALIAQGRAPFQIKLLPRSLIRTRERVSVKKMAIRFGALAAAMVVALLVLYALISHQRNAYIRSLTAQIAKIEPRAKGIFSKQKQLGILQHQVERSGSVIELLAAICDIFPSSDMNITRFQFVHKERIDIYGRAKSLKAIEKLAQDLRDLGKSSMPLLARAQQIYEQKNSEKGQEVLDYRISVPFPQAEGPAPDTEDTSSE